jgi:predicted Zn-dependent protease
LVALWQAPLGSAARAPSELRASASVDKQAALPATSKLAAHEKPPAPVLEHSEVPVPVVASPVNPATPDLGSMSPRRRLQRADLWLRVGSERGDREARGLLESALRDAPGDAHGQAALAEACLRLQDQACARSAVEKAREVRPWRGGYRTLARKIDAAFSTDR